MLNAELEILNAELEILQLLACTDNYELRIMNYEL